MDTKERQQIAELLTRVRQQQWEDTSFSAMKAHICAEFSALVYKDVQPYELKNNSRIHLFASSEFAQAVQSGKPRNYFAEIAGSENLEAQFFSVRTRYAVTLGTVVNDVVILAVRGTRFCRLWDWKANVDGRKFPCIHGRYGYTDDLYGDAESSGMFFHRGFAEAILPQFDSIIENLVGLVPRGREVRLMWTGHSLGGAMAAIAHSLIQSQFRYRYRLANDPFEYKPAGCYTFGMPRYGGLGVICSFPGPHHVYNPEDLVPTVPTRGMGFVDAAREYQLSPPAGLVPAERTDTLGIYERIFRLRSSIKAHSIEGYANILAKYARVTRP